MTHRLADWHFWLWSMLCGPVAWIILILGIAFVLKQLKLIRKWYIGLPLYYWPCMLLIILGAKNLSKKHCEWRKFEGKWYMTVHTAGFQEEAPKQ